MEVDSDDGFDDEDDDSMMTGCMMIRVDSSGFDDDSRWSGMEWMEWMMMMMMMDG